MTATLAPPSTLERFRQRTDLPDGAELILGEILLPMPESYLHLHTRLTLTAALIAVYGALRTIPEAPVLIPDDGEPRPDILVIRRESGFYLPHFYTAADVLLVVEVVVGNAGPAYTSKDRQYALGGIPEYWIVDPQAHVLEVRTEPGSLGYGRRALYVPGDEFRGLDLASFLG